MVRKSELLRRPAHLKRQAPAPISAFWDLKLPKRGNSEKGHQDPFTGKYCDFHERGAYRCICCGQDLSSSEAKFDPGMAWPSFMTPISDDNIATAVNTSHRMTRAEVKCARCDAHLGHVFDDGPEPSGKRYCLNSTVLDFEGVDGN